MDLEDLILKSKSDELPVPTESLGASTRAPFLVNDEPYDYSVYHNLTEINNWVDAFTANYPTRVTSKVFGETYENRDMKVMTITPENPDDSVGTIFIDCGIHAR